MRRIMFCTVYIVNLESNEAIRYYLVCEYFCLSQIDTSFAMMTV